MSAKIEHPRPAQVVAHRVVEARKSRGWNQAQLVKRLREIGYPKSRSTVTKLEGGRYRNVSVDDLFAFAAALGVSPVSLCVPIMGTTVAITPQVAWPGMLVRAWLRGKVAPPILPGVDLDQVSESELEEHVFAALSQDMDRRAAEQLADELKVAAKRIAEQIRNPDEREED